MAFEVVVKDLTTRQTGTMQASAKNCLQTTSIENFSGTPHNFEPEYNTAAKQNHTPWAALQTNISTQFETDHFEPCTSLSGMATTGFGDTYYTECHGPYETAGAPDKGSGSQ